MASKSAEGKEPVTRGTRNVFADLGFPDAAERQARLRLAYALNQELEARKISQADAAQVLGVTQPKVSALRRYKLEGFSVERLMNLLTALAQDVEEFGSGHRAPPVAFATVADLASDSTIATDSTKLLHSVRCAASAA